MIAIIGAGISGLSLAYFLQKKGIEYVLLEASNRVGGLINTSFVDGYTLETGPNSILCNAELTSFLQEIGLEKDIVQPVEISKNRFIFKEGKLRKLPSSPLNLFLGSYFNWETKKKIFKEWSLGAVENQNPTETIAQFFERRFNKDVFDYAVQPFVSGIYAGDATKILVNKAFPQLQKMEKQYGSILKGMMKEASGNRKKSLNFKNGMEQLPLALASKLKNVHLNTSVKNITQSGDGFEVVTPSQTFTANKVVLSIPSYTAADLLISIDPEISTALNRVNYVTNSAVYLAYKKADVSFKLDGFGSLNPAKENRFTAGTIWTSTLFPERCKSDEVLLTSFIGGALQGEQASLPDEELIQNTHQDVKEIYGITGNPVFAHVKRWSQAIPQYDRNILEVEKFIPRLQRRQIYVNANWNEGVSLGDCIEKSRKLAEEFGVKG